MICERIKLMRVKNHFSQADLARKLGITRSSVNAWELGISVPSTQYIVELASLFSVSTDYLLGLDKNNTINVDGLSDEDVEIIYGLIHHFKK